MRVWMPRFFTQLEEERAWAEKQAKKTAKKKKAKKEQAKKRQDGRSCEGARASQTKIAMQRSVRIQWARSNARTTADRAARSDPRFNTCSERRKRGAGAGKGRGRGRTKGSGRTWRGV